MYTYTSPSTVMVFRSNSLFSSFSDFYYFNDTPTHSSPPSPCYYYYSKNPFLAHGFTLSSRVLYGLRQSTLIQCSAPRSFYFTTRSSTNLYHGCRRRLAPPVSTSQSQHIAEDCVFHNLSEGGLRERGVGCCLYRERHRCGFAGGGSVDEMLSLLTDVVSRQDSVGGGLRGGESSVHDRRSGACGKVKEVKVDEQSKRQVNCRGHKLREGTSKSGGGVVIKAVEEYDEARQEDGLYRTDKSKERNVSRCSMREDKYHLTSDSWEGKSKGAVMVKSEDEEHRKSKRKEDSVREDNIDVKREASSSSYYSMSSSIDLDSNPDALDYLPERVIEESSSGHQNYVEQERSQQLERGEINTQYSESSRKKYNERISSKHESRERFSVIEDDVERESNEALQKHLEVSGYQDSSTRTTSRGERSSRSKMEVRETRSTSSAYLLHGAREQQGGKEQQVFDQNYNSKESQKISRISEMREGSLRRASSSQTTSKSRIEYRKEETALNVNLAEERSEYHMRADQQLRQKTKSDVRSQHLVDVSLIHDTDARQEIHDIDALQTIMQQGNSSMSAEDVDDNSSLILNSVQQSREHDIQDEQKVLDQSMEPQDLASVAEAHGALARFKVSGRTTNVREASSNSLLNRDQETREQYHLTDEQVIRHRRVQIDSQRHTIGSDFLDTSTERASSSSQTLVKARIKDQAERSVMVTGLVKETREQQRGESNRSGRNPQVMVTPPPSQLVIRESPAYYTQVDDSVDHVSSAPYTHSQEDISFEPHELDRRTQQDEMYEKRSEVAVSGSALDSATRLGNSSSQFVGEFMDKLHEEVSTSRQLSRKTKHSAETQKQSTSSTNATVKQDEKSRQPSSRRLSTGSGVKGPSDEMWDVAGPSSAEPSKTESSEKGISTTEVVETAGQEIEGNTTAKRSSRSMWGFIADLVRKGLGVRSESNTATMKSGTWSPSNDSLHSESWFSGNESDRGNDEIAKKGKSGTPKEPLVTTTQVQQVSEVSSSQHKITQVESDSSASTSKFERDCRSKGTSLAPEEGYAEEIVEEKVPEAIASSQSSLPSVGISPSSRPVTGHKRQNISDRGEVQVSTSGTAVMIEEPIREESAEITRTEGQDKNLKQRKLQRNKQVLRENFEEWEEAIRLEHEQRKTDELFMREALSEAKKAADSWEVPVGAVLVQNGKIIARGCNLVEELRDSTAHAEMICIREASNLLRTWRLAETTLYVTLEPCPMCAGAILQARIDTVVWGAPNKLLGADGSWVSLFPAGEEEANRSDCPAAPVHPFHPKMTIRRGVLATECAEVMQQFFQLRRKNNKKTEAPTSRHHPFKFFSKLHNMFHIMFCL